MAVDYTKTKTGDYNVSQLQSEINSDSIIIPSCLSVTGNGTELVVEMAAAISPSEETQLDAIILAHVLTPAVVDVTKLPISPTLEGGKLAVHNSSKPQPSGVTTYAVWAGSGDDINEPDEILSIGAGDLLSFNMSYGVPVTTKDIRFDPRHGRVWVHEAYMKFENGGIPDYLTADIIAPATQLQQVADLDYIIDSDWLKYSPGGPGTGTHGLGGTPVLLPRGFSKDGDWDYDGTNLTPNFGGTGGYKITTIERAVHRYFNKIPLRGSSTTYFSMTSDETAELPVNLGYFLRVNVYNESNTNWSASIIMELYRERTVVP